MRILKPPGRAWYHADCVSQHRGRNSQPDDDLDRLMRAPSRMRPLPTPPALHQLAARRNDLAAIKSPAGSTR